MSVLSEWSASFKIYRAKFNSSWPAKLTVIWLLLVVGSSALNWKAFCNMGPNEWGDFLAGTMSPIAFMWLVFGYLQQGRELKQNTEALHLQQKALLLQHEELAEQVKATLKVATHGEQQAEISKAMYEFNLDQAKSISEENRLRRRQQIRPSFVVKMGSRSSERWNLSVHNVGFTAHNVNIKSANFFEVFVQEDKSVFPDDSAWSVQLNRQKPRTATPFMEIEFLDIDGNLHSAFYTFDANSNRIELIEQISI